VSQTSAILHDPESINQRPERPSVTTDRLGATAPQCPLKRFVGAGTDTIVETSEAFSSGYRCGLPGGSSAIVLLPSGTSLPAGCFSSAHNGLAQEYHWDEHPQ
jgi:hypothetical protein